MPYRQGKIGTAHGLQQGLLSMGQALSSISQQQRERERMEKEEAWRQKQFDAQETYRDEEQEYRAGRDRVADDARYQSREDDLKNRAIAFRGQGRNARRVEAPDAGIVNPTTARQGREQGAMTPGRALAGESERNRPSTLAVGDEWNPDSDIDFQRSKRMNELQHDQYMERLRANPSRQGVQGLSPDQQTMVESEAIRLLHDHGNNFETALEAAGQLGNETLQEYVTQYLSRLRNEEYLDSVGGGGGDDYFNEGGGGGYTFFGGDGQDPPPPFDPDTDIAPGEEGGYDNPVQMGGMSAAPPGPPDWFRQQYDQAIVDGEELPPLEEAYRIYQSQGRGGG